MAYNRLVKTISNILLIIDYSILKCLDQKCTKHTWNESALEEYRAQGTSYLFIILIKINIIIIIIINEN